VHHEQYLSVLLADVQFGDAASSLQGAERRSNPSLGKREDGLLRFARNDGW
jgi:hypothetical protein